MKWKCLFSMYWYSHGLSATTICIALHKRLGWVVSFLLLRSPDDEKIKKRFFFFFFHIFELLWVGGERKGPLMPRKQCAYIKERANQFTRGNESETEQRRQSNPIGPPLLRPSSFLRWHFLFSSTSFLGVSLELPPISYLTVLSI